MNGLLKAVRTRRVAFVVVDLAEPWTSTRTLLGLADDPIYERVEASRLQGTRCLLKLRRRRPRTTSRVQVEPPPAEVAVISSRCHDHALHLYEVRLLVRGTALRRTLQVAAENPDTGALQAAGAALAEFHDGPVALPLKGAFLVLDQMLGTTTEGRASNVDFFDAVRTLKGVWSWSVHGQWVVGAPRGVAPRP